MARMAAVMDSIHDVQSGLAHMVLNGAREAIRLE